MGDTRAAAMDLSIRRSRHVLHYSEGWQQWVHLNIARLAQDENAFADKLGEGADNSSGVGVTMGRSLKVPA